MLYKVEWELVPWMAATSYLAELSPEEVQELERLLGAHSREVVHWRIWKVDGIRSLEDLRGIFEENLKEIGDPS